ncbi:MAG: type II secretion system protein, partial [Lentisphaeraceae bacterium]|nr:type II secretion system protein [Lentisphaeraceae bacterium]
MKLKNTKRKFTLVELMVAMSISIVSLAMAGQVLIQYLGVFEDDIAETQLISFAYNLK